MDKKLDLNWVKYSDIQMKRVKPLVYDKIFRIWNPFLKKYEYFSRGISMNSIGKLSNDLQDQGFFYSDQQNKISVVKTLIRVRENLVAFCVLRRALSSMLCVSVSSSDGPY